MELYQVTGNEYVSFPTLRQSDASVEGITFLYMAARGMIELRGNTSHPLLRPAITINGRQAPFTALSWERLHCWIPTFTATAGGLEIRGTLLCPTGERGFLYRLEARNTSGAKASCRVALEGCWEQTLHEVNEAKPVDARIFSIQSNWNHAFVMEARSAFPLFAFAPILDSQSTYHAAPGENGGVLFVLEKTKDLAPGEAVTADFIFGIGYEEVAASTSAKELQRQGYAKLFAATKAWLCQRERTIADPYLHTLCNTNMFFSFFFASGRTLDTEELVMMTSRSPRYYVSCAYWDRDSLLWSFPAILMADPGYAKNMLEHVFTRQIRNVGIHSRFIDGTILEPGFELDELCAPIIALDNYLHATNDSAFFNEPVIQNGISRILTILETKKHTSAALYETFLMPTDDVCTYPYLTYNNVLVWKVLYALGNRMQRPELLEQAERVKQAIHRYCIQPENGTRFYCWSTDLQQQYDVYDEPPGSLLLLPHLGFCDADDPVYLATVAKIRDAQYRYSFAGKPIAEIGCAHAPHPWVLSVANSLLSGNAQAAFAHLRRMRMDNGIACESVHEETGECATGEAFATCAGFLAYAIDQALRN